MNVFMGLSWSNESSIYSTGSTSFVLGTAAGPLRLVAPGPIGCSGSRLEIERVQALVGDHGCFGNAELPRGGRP